MSKERKKFRETVELLLSEKGDHQAMANNICRLLEDSDFADMNRWNAGVTTIERISNAEHFQK